MATSKRDPPNPKEKNIRITPTPKTSDGSRKARSVPSSPDRKFSSLPSRRSPDHKSFSASSSRTVASLSRPTASSSRQITSTRGKTLHPPVTPITKPAPSKAKPEKSLSPQPQPISIPGKDVRAARSPILPKTRLSPRTTSTDKAPATLRIGRSQTMATPRSSGANAKKKEANGPLSRTSSAPAESAEVACYMEKQQEEEPSFELGDGESISSPSIEESLHDDLPDPVEAKVLEVISNSSFRTEQEPGSEEIKEIKDMIIVSDENADGECLEERKIQAKDMNGNGKQEVETKCKMVNEALNKETDKKVERELSGKRLEATQGWRKEAQTSNAVIEETRSKLLVERKSSVKALVGAFETVMSFKERDTEGQSQEKGGEEKSEQ